MTERMDHEIERGLGISAYFVACIWSQDSGALCFSGNARRRAAGQNRRKIIAT